MHRAQPEFRQVSKSGPFTSLKNLTTILALMFGTGIRAMKGNGMIKFAILLLPLVLVGLAALIYFDVILPRNRRQIKRQKRKEARRLGKFRSRISTELWTMRKTRRLADQRQLGRDDR
jgi:hypothetical protein